jgi:hypothetical protein
MKCYKFQEQNCTGCKIKECRYWISDKSSGNCVIVGTKKKEWTLQDIGDLFGVTRMRICQIEKQVLSKIKKKINL